MANHTGQLGENMQNWLRDNACRPSDAMKYIWESTQNLEDAEMLTSPEQLQFLAFIATSIGAVNAIEIGVYTGASALAVAEVLPENGSLIACDSTNEYVQLATSAWELAGVEQKIELKIGSALDSLQTLLGEGKANTFDFMYIDADKINSKNYYELGLQLLRTGGIIAIDNMFYGGQVADGSIMDVNTVATRELAAVLIDDTRITYALIPIGDGLGICFINTY